MKCGAIVAALAAAVLAGVAAPAAAGKGAAEGSAVFRCLYRLPGVACQLAGIAVKPPAGPVVASACPSPTLTVGAAEAPVPDDYCKGLLPLEDRQGGVLLLGPPTAGLAPELARVPVVAGFGGAEWGAGDEVWLAMYSEEAIGRLRLDSTHPEGGAIETLLPVPGGGRIGGLAFDGDRLYVHQTERDVILVLDAATGGRVDQLPVPVPDAVNGLAYLGGRLFAAINDDNMSGDSIGHGPAQEAIVALDPADGRELARWNLPAGIYPHSMDRFGDNGLAVMVQTEPGPLAPVYLWELVLPPGGGSGMNNPVTAQPCSENVLAR